MFEKICMNKKCFILKEKALSSSIFSVLVCGYLSAAMFIFFLADFLAVSLERS